MPNMLIGYNEIARRLGVDRITVWKWVRAGRFPAPLRIGRARRWKESTVDEWINNLEERSGRKHEGGAT